MESPKYEIGDLVMLKGTTLKTRSVSKKIDIKLRGPFQIGNVIILTAIQVTLPRLWWIHKVFLVNSLEPDRTSIQQEAVDPT
jgi:hypothetical protein